MLTHAAIHIMKPTDVETLLQLAAQADEMRPAIKHLKRVLLSYGDDIADVLRPMTDYAADSSARVFKRLRDDHGLEDEVALELTLNIMSNIKQSLSSGK